MKRRSPLADDGRLKRRGGDAAHKTTGGEHEALPGVATTLGLKPQICGWRAASQRPDSLTDAFGTASDTASRQAERLGRDSAP
jgi:hypothetical protein